MPVFAAKRQTLALGCTAVILAGLFTFEYFRVLSSLGLAALLLVALLQPDLLQRIRSLARRKAYLGFAAVFLLHGLTFTYTDSAFYGPWWQGLLLKLPFLLLPLALGLLAPWPERWLTLLYYLFLQLVFLAALYSLGRYWLDYDQINHSYHRSGVMPTLVNHVRFSLMVAFSVFIGLRLSWKKFYWLYAWERKWIGFLTLFLFVFLHVLAVRSGLLAMYAVVLTGLTYLVIVKRQFRRGLALMFLLLLIPVLSYVLLPTFREKLHYTFYDLGQWQQESKANNYSLTGRLYSYRVGIAVWQQRPLIGWGMGHIPEALAQNYKDLFPAIQPQAYLLPHNQYLYYLALFGITGLVVFLGCFYYPLVSCFRQADVLFAVHYLIISFSFLFEPTLETQVGLFYSLIFILLPLACLQVPEETGK